MQKSDKTFSRARLFSSVKTALSEARNTLSGFAAALAGRLGALASQSGIARPAVRQYAALLGRTLLAFLLSIAHVSQELHPFGIALLCSVSDGKALLFSYVGCAIGSLLYGREALTWFLVYFLLYAARKSFAAPHFEEKLSVRLTESGLFSALAGILRLVSRRESPLYAVIALIVLVSLAVCFTYFFSYRFSPSLSLAASLPVRSISTYALIGASVCAFSGVTAGGFDLCLIAGIVLTLAFSAANGFLHGALCGMICGLAAGDPSLSVSLGSAGLVCGLFFGKSIPASLVSFAAAFLVSRLYGAPLSASLSVFPSLLAGTVLFFPVCAVLPDAFVLSPSVRPTAPVTRFSRGASAYQKRLSDAFFTVSDTFSKLADKQKYPSFTDTSCAVDRAFAEVCTGCALGEMCYARRKTDEDDRKQTLYSVLSLRAAVPDDLGSVMKEKCIRTEALCDRINSLYRLLIADCVKDNRSSLLSAQYASMARLLCDLESTEEDLSGRDKPFEKRVAEALRKADIPFSGVTVSSHREKKTAVSGVDPMKIRLGADELRRYLHAECGIRMGQIAFRCEESGEQTLVFERADAISVDYAHVTSPGKPDAVNGDTVSFRQSARHTFHAFLCDGMGSGREAAAASRLASLFLETMTDAGMKMNVLFELLNNVLLSQSGECFSTVDALEIDLLTGTCRFIKAGAAPTYIVRGSRLFKIASETPPVGILASFSAESTRFDLQSGDMILLISDGILFPSESAPDADDTGWLAELIRADLSGDPAVIAQRIADFADRRDGVKDDRTVAVIRIKEPLAE